MVISMRKICYEECSGSFRVNGAGLVKYRKADWDCRRNFVHLMLSSDSA